MKSGNLHFLEPSGPVTGLLYLYMFVFVVSCIMYFVLRFCAVCVFVVTTVLPERK